MSTIIGTIRKTEDGSYRGNLKTLTVRAEIDIVPVDNPGPNGPHFRIFAGTGFEAGAVWRKTSRTNGTTYLSFKLDAPELPQTLYGNLGRQPGQDDEDVLCLIWSRD